MKRRLTKRMLALFCAGTFSFVLPASAGLLRSGTQEASVSGFSKNGLAGSAISFSQDDFRVSGDASISSIVITSLPDPGAGVLTIGGQGVPLGSEVAMSAVDGLRFDPLAAGVLTSASFTFTPVFSDGTAGEDVPVSLHLLSAPNHPPVAEALSLSTYKNVEVCGTFAGVDPEGDTLTFQLVSKPARGSVTQDSDGSAAFVYTPYENKTGKDAFTYVAVDELGNTSAPATVSIKIEKQKTKVTYSDMTGVEGHREAVRLAEAGMLVGEKMGETYFFHPEQTISRAQFTALAMAVADMDGMDGVKVTGFADDEAMALWAKPYVSAALRSGMVRGSFNEQGQVVFLPNAPVTAAEAAVLLDRALGITDVPSVSETMADVPAWCVQAVADLDSCGAMPASAALSEPLTRAQAAIMLDRAMDVMDSRDQGGWFNWG